MLDIISFKPEYAVEVANRLPRKISAAIDVLDMFSLSNADDIGMNELMFLVAMEEKISEIRRIFEKQSINANDGVESLRIAVDNAEKKVFQVYETFHPHAVETAKSIYVINKMLRTK